MSLHEIDLNESEIDLNESEIDLNESAWDWSKRVWDRSKRVWTSILTSKLVWTLAETISVSHWRRANARLV